MGGILRVGGHWRIMNSMIGPMDTSGGESGKIELSVGEHAEGNYSNFVVITHTASEFVLDFAAIMPGMQKAQVVSRVVLTPEHTKRLLGALGQNLQRYESKFGTITLPIQSDSE
jgi:hypothetical protein